MAQTFPLSIENLEKKLQILPKDMRIMMSNGKENYYLEDVIVEAADRITIKLAPVELFPPDITMDELNQLNKDGIL